MNKVHQLGKEFGDQMLLGIERSKEVSKGNKHWKEISQQYHLKGRNFSKDLLYGTFGASWGLTFTAVLINKSRWGLWGISLLTLSSAGIYFTFLRKPFRVQHTEPHSEPYNGIPKRASTSSVQSQPLKVVNIPLLSPNDPLITTKAISSLSESLPSETSVLNLSEIQLGVPALEVWTTTIAAFKARKEIEIDEAELTAAFQFFDSFSPEKCFDRSKPQFKHQLLDKQTVHEYQEKIISHLDKHLAGKTESMLEFEFQTFSRKEQPDQLCSASDIVTFLSQCPDVTSINLGSLACPQVVFYIETNNNIERLYLQIEMDGEHFQFNQFPEQLRELFIESTQTTSLHLGDKDVGVILNSNLRVVGLKRIFLTSGQETSLKKQFEVSADNPAIYNRKISS